MGRACSDDLPDGESGKFFEKGLDMFTRIPPLICPTGKSDRLMKSERPLGREFRPLAAWPPCRPSAIDDLVNRTGLPMNKFASLTLPRSLLAALLVLAVASPALAADDPGAKDGPQGAAVTVITASKFCFPNLVESFGILIPREETMVRAERPGLKVSEILAEPGENVTAGQNLARLTLPEGGTTLVTAPVAGLMLSSTATIGAPASPRGEALFTIIARGEFDLVGMVPTQDLSKLAVNQPARIRIVGAGEVEGKVRRVASTVEPNSQLGQVFVGITTNRKLFVNSSGRAMIKTGQSCGVAVPLTAVLYGSAGTVVQVVRRARIETKRVEIGLMAGGQVEIRDGLTEGDIVVARAGALLREGDPVRPVTASAEAR
jgi:HlyD family secretion protein